MVDIVISDRSGFFSFEESRVYRFTALVVGSPSKDQGFEGAYGAGWARDLKLWSPGSIAAPGDWPSEINPPQTQTTYTIHGEGTRATTQVLKGWIIPMSGANPALLGLMRVWLHEGAPSPGPTGPGAPPVVVPSPPTFPVTTSLGTVLVMGAAVVTVGALVWFASRRGLGVTGHTRT